ncbi:hypothetical protein GALL_453500 [mine drainage metagenome]|uniref:Uncharacterized protein n=1 Tax=mine drainage metagenome TaxID=410659 RepID=A0A1J5PND8_9ZZZZ
MSRSCVQSNPLANSLMQAKRKFFSGVSIVVRTSEILTRKYSCAKMSRIPVISVQGICGCLNLISSSNVLTASPMTTKSYKMASNAVLATSRSAFFSAVIRIFSEKLIRVTRSMMSRRRSSPSRGLTAGSPQQSHVLERSDEERSPEQHLRVPQEVWITRCLA